MIIRTVLALLLLTGSLAAQPFPHGVVSSAEPLASEAGAAVLRAGGNAADAAVTTFFMLAVTYPQAGNLGGGGFYLVRTAEGDVEALDFREKAPAAAHRDMYLDAAGEHDPDMSQLGALAAGVPGSVAGVWAFHRKHGTRPWAELLAPAITAARDGFAMPRELAAGLNGNRRYFARFGSTGFIAPGDSIWETGDLFRQPDLATTLERIAERGPAGFYQGETAAHIIATMQRLGGRITEADLSAYQPVWRQPAHTTFRGDDIWMMPLPSSGSLVLTQVLKFLEPYDLAGMGPASAEFLHLMAEAQRRAFADRNRWLGDPDFVGVPMAGLVHADYLKDRWAGFNPGAATPSSQVGAGDAPAYESPETTHFSVVDRDGMAVGITTTLNGTFGGFAEVRGAGFLLNNEMDDFTAKPGAPNMFGLVMGEANAIAPGKRMLSSMVPTIVARDGHIRMVLGAAGGPRIITAVLHGYLNGAVFGMDAEAAVAAPRFHHQHLPDRISADPGWIPPAVAARLEGMGHRVVETAGPTSRAHFIFVRADGARVGAADPRGYGASAGH